MNQTITRILEFVEYDATELLNVYVLRTLRFGSSVSTPSNGLRFDALIHQNGFDFLRLFTTMIARVSSWNDNCSL